MVSLPSSSWDCSPLIYCFIIFSNILEFYLLAFEELNLTKVLRSLYCQFPSHARLRFSFVELSGRGLVVSLTSFFPFDVFFAFFSSLVSFSISASSFFGHFSKFDGLCILLCPLSFSYHLTIRRVYHISNPRVLLQECNSVWSWVARFSLMICCPFRLNWGWPFYYFCPLSSCSIICFACASDFIELPLIFSPANSAPVPPPLWFKPFEVSG